MAEFAGLPPLLAPLLTPLLPLPEVNAGVVCAGSALPESDVGELVGIGPVTVVYTRKYSTSKYALSYLLPSPTT
jgi:hypothetical protein